MAKIKRESFDSFKDAQVDEKEAKSFLSQKAIGETDATTTKANNDHDNAVRHLSLVKKELEDRAEGVTPDSPDTGKQVKNPYTKTYKLDESIEDFNINSVRVTK